MPDTVRKTLQATLAPPTTGKEQRLQHLLDTYRDALAKSFDSGASTMSAVNDIVTPFDLPYQAKDALKSFVPKLRKTYNAKEIHDEHLIRLVNRAAKFDHSDERVHEFVWQVPMPGRGANFWIPLRINPEQESLWFDLLGDDAKAGELRLQRHRKSWELHVTVEYEVPEPDPSDDPTPIGFDIGESKLLVGCAYQHDTPTQPMIVDGGRARVLRKEMFTTLRRLQERDAEQWQIDERFNHYQNALTDIVEKASRQAVDYAEQFDDPVIVMEDLSYIREHLDYGKFMNRRLHNWAFARLSGRIEDKATEAGIPVACIEPAYTSKTCHACGHLGRRNVQSKFECTNSECWVTEYQGDINAAGNIAGRLDPWGESLPWKLAGDDSPRNGSGSDTASVHREQSAPTQMTLSSYSD